MYLPEPDPPLDPRYQTTTDCLELLRREPELHQMVKRAHAEESYDLVRASALIRKPPQPLPEEARKYLDNLRPFLESFISDHTSHMWYWDPDDELTDPAMPTHMKSLELVTIGYGPEVILKDLGSFMDDPVLASRVKNLFVRGKKTVMVNTSGSGKTRLTFEGRCHNWGFYFVTRPLWERDLGARDMGAQIHWQDNHSHAERRLGQAFPARLLIFCMFLGIAKEGGLAEIAKMKWLILQLLGQLRGHYGDIFESLMELLYDYDAGEAIPETLESIRGLVGSDFHLFLVVDEGHAAANSSRHEDKHLPTDSTSCVIAGTEFPTHIFEATQHAAQMRLTSDTGSFNERVVHEHYLRRFLPSSFLDTQSGKEFLQRAWVWTRGRHRLTALLMDQMLVWHFEKPHQVLDSYITQLSGFKPTDDQQLPFFNRDLMQAVSLNFGRFVGGDPNAIAVDEPIALAGMAVWMTREPSEKEAFGACLAFYFSRAFYSKHKHKLSDIFTFPSPVPVWAKQATLGELHAEAGKVRSSAIPDTEIIAPLATSANSLEEVVSWMEHSSQTPFCIPDAEAFDLLFVLRLESRAHIWVIMRVGPTTSDGGDLLKSLEETNLPVLRCSTSESFSRLKRESDTDSPLHERALGLLNTSPTTGGKTFTPTVFRVVAAFENQIVHGDSQAKGSPPQASLCLDTFQRLTAAQPLSAFAETVVANVLKQEHEVVDDESRGLKRNASTADDAEIQKDNVKRRAKSEPSDSMVSLDGAAKEGDPAEDK
ncbi:hypothetical protein C8R45DRAFT_929848 [Mycena sanguinolenta]|nr:hypothetical protein C8R45DRAFT_929848 [Mycena sanguinolenta]